MIFCSNIDIYILAFAQSFLQKERESPFSFECEKEGKVCYLPFILLGALLVLTLIVFLFIPGEEGRRKRALKCPNKRIETTLEPTHDGLYVVVFRCPNCGWFTHVWEPPP